MKSVNEKFEDKEFELIEQIKKETGMSWHDFMLKIAKAYPVEKARIQAGNGFEELQVPANGRVRLTRAAGKIIEWRIKA